MTLEASPTTAAGEAASPWPHRWAVVLCCATFPLLWVGGLITTTDAGMAVPDWPNTYGYNMFAYPWQTWMFGPWDLFIEHGHRLLASLVGLLTIALLTVVCLREQRRWLVPLCVAALALVIFQGVLGGLRVVVNERLIAMAHGSTGPAFFALTCALVVLTSRSRQATKTEQTTNAVGHAGLAKLATLTAGLAYLQLVLGASLRHVGASVGPWSFATLVKFHLAMAAIVAIHTLLVAWKTRRTPAASPSTRWIGGLLVVVVTAQVTLGFATWLAKYGAPRWAADWLPATINPITAGGWSQTHTVTAHSAIGSLLLGLLVTIAVIAWRRVPRRKPAESTLTSQTLTTAT
ncbi:MAG: COX15/CtaA family protein [Planctomycetota bacterium]